MDLGLLFVEQAYQLVILINGFERLDEYGLSAGTGAVDHALDTAFLLHLYRNHETFAADGDEFVLHRAAFGEFAQIAAQRLLNLALLLFGFTANSAQFSRGAIVECAVGQNLVMKGPQKRGEILNTAGKSVHGAPVGTHGSRRLANDFAPLGGAVGDEDHIANLGGFESGSADAGFLY